MAVYGPIIWEIVRYGTAGQSFATWGLWAGLDSMLTVALWLQHGNYLLSLGYAVGGVALTVVLLQRGGFSWGRFETIITLLVLGMSPIWKSQRPAQRQHCGNDRRLHWWRSRDFSRCCATRNRRRARFGPALRSPAVCPILAGTGMTVEERLTPAAFTILSVVMFVASCRPPKGK